jgi:hypothetical protein
MIFCRVMISIGAGFVKGFNNDELQGCRISLSKVTYRS